MKIANMFFKLSVLTLLLLTAGVTQTFADTAKIIFGGQNPGKKFVPVDTTVMVGDTILWLGHFGAADPFHALQSETIPTGATPFGPIDSMGKTSFFYVVKVAGHYHYQCNNHCCDANDPLKKAFMQGDFTAVAADVSTSINGETALEKNYPNPFNGTTTISYALKNPSKVTLKVFDLNGKAVKTLVNKTQNAGSYEVAFDGGGLPSGTYIYRLITGESILTKEMVLVKQ